MSVPVVTFFNNKGGVGKTSLVYHLAWMLSDMDYRVLACDLDPQANLTAAFLDEDRLEGLWSDEREVPGRTIMRCVKPLMEVGDVNEADLVQITSNICLIAGDLALAGFEDTLSVEWPNALGSGSLYRSFRVLTSFSIVAQEGADQISADIVLMDVGPNLGAINRSALIATDYIVVPLGADLFSMQGLRNLGPTLDRWRKDWTKRYSNWSSPRFELPEGLMEPIGYVIQQHGVRLKRPVRAYDKWVNRMPEEYARNLLGDQEGPYAATPMEDDLNALATLKHFRSLVPMAQEARKPIFHLTPADGAFGGHARAAYDAGKDYRSLAGKIVDRIGLVVRGTR